MRKMLPWLAVVLFLVSGPAASQPRVGSEFAVIPPAGFARDAPVVAIDDEGRFVVVWNEGFGAGSVRGRVFDRDGQQIVDLQPTFDGGGPEIAMHPAGPFVVVWEERSPLGFRSVHGAQFLAGAQGGAGLGRVSNTSYLAFFGQPRVDLSKKGRFVVAWMADNGGIFGQRFKANGRRKGFEFEASDPFDRDGDVGLDRRGAFTIVWETSPGLGISARQFKPNGRPRGAEFTINSEFGGGNPRIAMRDNGDFVVVFEDGGGVFGRCFKKSGRPLGRQFQVNTHVPGTQRKPAVDMDDSGRFVVVWESFEQDGDDRGVYGQQFSSRCQRVGREFRANTETFDDQADPDVALSSNGDFVVVWVSHRQGGPSRAVFAQRFRFGP